MLRSNRFICVLLLIAFNQQAYAAQQAGAPVRAAPVEMVETQKRSVVSGTVRARHRSDVSFQESGLLTKILVREGDMVKKGQKIAVLDSRRLQLEKEHAALAIQLAQTEIIKRAASLKNAKNEFQRRKKTSETTDGLISEEVLEQAETKLNIAQAEYSAAQSELAQMENALALTQLRIQDTELFAPFDGHIIKRTIDPGEWLVPGQAVVSVISSGELEAVFDVAEQHSMEYVSQMKALVVILNNGVDSISAESFRVVPDVDPRSRRYVLKADFDAGEKIIVPGMSVSCAIASSERTTYKMIPSDALMRDNGGAYVYKVSEQPNVGSISMPVPVKLLFIDGDRVAVVSQSLMENDQVVVEGNERLRPMMPLQVLEGKQP